MIEDLPDVPPAVPLLLAELVRGGTYEDARRRVKGMLRELRDQSEVFLLESAGRQNYTSRPDLFQVHLQGALDLFAGEGCEAFSCRREAADRVARSVGLGHGSFRLL